MVVMRVSPKVIRLIDEIRNDKVHGASELARQAARVLKVAAERSEAGSAKEFLLEHKEVGERLMSARPAMAPVFNIISSLLKTIVSQAGGTDLNSLRHFTIAKADEAIGNSLQAIARIAQYGSELVSEGDKIMTHSYSSTVLAMLEVAFTKHRSIEVMATRSGPGRTGESIVRQLKRCGVAVTFIDDTAMGFYISTVNKAVVGADRVCADGRVVNGIGTYQLALVAERAGIPFYVLCDTLKFDPRLRSDEVDLEEKESSEVVEAGGLPSRVIVKNPYFDITPLELVTGIVTEQGLLMPEDVITYMSRLKTASLDIPEPRSP